MAGGYQANGVRGVIDNAHNAFVFGREGRSKRRCSGPIGVNRWHACTVRRLALPTSVGIVARLQPLCAVENGTRQVHRARGNPFSKGKSLHSELATGIHRLQLLIERVTVGIQKEPHVLFARPDEGHRRAPLNGDVTPAPLRRDEC